MTTIAVIGAGFSGSLLALHLLRRCPRGTRVELIERNSSFGRGPAYSSGNPSHLLNVPAGKMSGFHDAPGDFVEWLRTLPDDPAGGACPDERSFVPRRLFGAYVRYLISQELKQPEAADRLALVHGAVEAIDCGDRLALSLDRGRTLAADIAVLAVGNFPPEPPPVADPAFFATSFYRPDPWAPESFADLDPQAAILLVGTGLTMVDAVISLLDQGHRGPIHALSRRGLTPRRHGAGIAPAPLHAFPADLGPLVRQVRRLCREGGWQAVIDGLRPFTQDLWQSATLEDRARFLRHLRPWWDVHRHRICAAVADRIAAAEASGQLRIAAGRIQGFAVAGGGATVRYRPRRTPGLAEMRVERVVNCSGPGCDYDRVGDPLIRSLLAEGRVRPDMLRLGLDVSPCCALKDRQGALSRRLYGIGPVTKGTFWEVTAVPDIRRQCDLLSAHIASLAVPAAPARAVPA